MDFKDKVVVITGGSQGIGKKTAEMFKELGAHVCLIDLLENEYFQGDIGDKETLIQFAHKVITDYGHVDYIINNAKPLFKGIDECSYEEFEYALRVGVTAPFMLVKLLKPYFNEGASIVNISSSRDAMSQAQSESYTAAKGGIHALTHALAISLAGIARVNSISPGWIETTDKKYDGPDALQHPVKRVGRCEDIAEMILFLCSEKAGFITGENIKIDGGMSKLMIYHDEDGWKYQ
ncbi:MAG: SDR family oxidoreductase [Coprobacillus cateniformis]|uniref:SDR family NAD(P)-dependent oxidoreductase n=1 Tax=Longibaculum muris TaxID=1796628 RepID=UPI003AB3810D|nr:SDR family oxidoreductase [Coprobacillus cateniformis]